ncbi:ankyrin repeat-containing domain protein [Aspergillus oleicola]
MGNRFHKLPPELQLKVVADSEPKEQLSVLRLSPHFGALFGPKEFASTDDKGRTVVHLIAEGGFPRSHVLMRYLNLSRSLVVRARDKDQRTPLMYALKHENWLVFNMLLEKDPAGISLFDADGNTALHLAVQERSAKAAVLLLAQDSIDVNHQNHLGRTALYESVCRNDHGMADMLLKNSQIDVDIRETQFGRPPLVEAADRGLERLVRMILDHETVDVNAIDSNGCTALTKAIYYDHYEIRDLLLADPAIDVNYPTGRWDSPLLTATTQHRWDSMRVLFTHADLDIDATDINNWTTLMWAAQENNNDAIRLLRERGARADIVGSNGEIALSLLTEAHNKDFLEMVDLLRPELLQN